MNQVKKIAPSGAVSYTDSLSQGHDGIKNRTPVKAIRAYCLDCACGSMLEVRLCPAINCPLFRYRMGKRPKTADILQGSKAPSDCAEMCAG